MSKYAELTIDDFLFLDAELKKMGYVPLPVKKGEQGYKYLNPKNKKVPFFWSSFLPSEGKFREAGEDAGRAGIKDLNDEIVYMAKPFPRTANFIPRSLRYAAINKERADNPPICPHCGQQMEIYRQWKTKTGEPTRRYWWYCDNYEAHPDGKEHKENWNTNLSDATKEYLNIRRERYIRYKKARNKKKKEQKEK